MTENERERRETKTINALSDFLLKYTFVIFIGNRCGCVNAFAVIALKSDGLVKFI